MNFGRSLLVGLIFFAATQLAVADGQSIPRIHGEVTENNFRGLQAFLKARSYQVARNLPQTIVSLSLRLQKNENNLQGIVTKVTKDGLEIKQYNKDPYLPHIEVVDFLDSVEGQYTIDGLYMVSIVGFHGEWLRLEPVNLVDKHRDISIDDLKAAD